MEEIFSTLFIVFPIIFVVFISLLTTCSFIVVGKIYSSIFQEKEELSNPVYKNAPRCFLIIIGTIIFFMILPIDRSFDYNGLGLFERSVGVVIITAISSLSMAVIGRFVYKIIDI